MPEQRSTPRGVGSGDRPARPPMMGPGRPFGMPGGMAKAKDARGTLLRLWGYLRRYRGALLGTTLLVALTTVLGVLGPYLMGRAIDLYILKGDLPGLARIASLMIAIIWSRQRAPGGRTM